MLNWRFSQAIHRETGIGEPRIVRLDDGTRKRLNIADTQTSAADLTPSPGEATEVGSARPRPPVRADIAVRTSWTGGR